MRNPVVAVISALGVCIGFVLMFTAFLLVPFLVVAIATGDLYAAGWRKKRSRVAHSEPSADVTAGGGEGG